MNEVVAYILVLLVLWSFIGLQVRYVVDGEPHVFEFNVDILYKGQL